MVKSCAQTQGRQASGRFSKGHKAKRRVERIDYNELRVSPEGTLFRFNEMSEKLPHIAPKRRTVFWTYMCKIVRDEIGDVATKVMVHPKNQAKTAAVSNPIEADDGLETMPEQVPYHTPLSKECDSDFQDMPCLLGELVLQPKPDSATCNPADIPIESDDDLDSVPEQVPYHMPNTTDHDSDLKNALVGEFALKPKPDSATCVKTEADEDDTLHRATKPWKPKRSNFLAKDIQDESNQDKKRKAVVLAAIDLGLAPGPPHQSLEIALSKVAFDFEAKLCRDGVSGTYFLADVNNLDSDSPLFVFKPRDEEPSAPNNPKELRASDIGRHEYFGCKAGDGMWNEYVAFLVDQMLPMQLRAGVPATSLAMATHTNFYNHEEYLSGVTNACKTKCGSLQLFVQNAGSASVFSDTKFCKDDVHRIIVLDIIIHNQDRHMDNILVRKENDLLRLTPIDHAFAFPSTMGGARFSWMNWGAASEPFDEQFAEHILAISFEQIQHRLRVSVPALPLESFSIL